ncbi:unnamed protein product [Symbiodinium sp. KB8]|nr:unnamed protein product [Symbiodinium sp. KB8]
MAKELGPRARERALAVAADVARRIQVELTQSAESVELPPMRGKSVQNLRKLYGIGSQTADVALQASCARLSMAGVTLTWQTRKKCVAVASPSMPAAHEPPEPPAKKKCREPRITRSSGGRPRGVEDEVGAAILLANEIRSDLDAGEDTRAQARLATKSVRERFSVGSEVASNVLRLARARLSMAGLQATRVKPRAKILVYRKPVEEATRNPVVNPPKLPEPSERDLQGRLRNRLDNRKAAQASPSKIEIQVISSDEEEEAKQQSASPARATRARPGSLGRHPASPATPGPSAPSGPKRSSSRPSALRKRSTSQAPPTSTRLCSPGVSPEHSSPQPPASPVSVDPLLQSPASKGRPRWRDGVIKVEDESVASTGRRSRSPRQIGNGFARCLSMSRWLQWGKKLRRIVRQSRSIRAGKRKTLLKHSGCAMKQESIIKQEHVKSEPRVKKRRAKRANSVGAVLDFSTTPNKRGNRKTSRPRPSQTAPSTLCISQVPGWLMRVVLYAGGNAFPVACTHRLAAWSILCDSRQVSSELRALSLSLGHNSCEPADQMLLDEMQRVVQVLSALTPLDGPCQAMTLPRRRLRLDRVPLEASTVTKRVKQEVKEELVCGMRLSSCSSDMRKVAPQILQDGNDEMIPDPEHIRSLEPKAIVAANAVSSEELEESSYLVPKDAKATLCLYRRSSLEYRRSAEAEAELQYEAFKLRYGMGDIDCHDDSHFKPDDSLIVAAPHCLLRLSSISMMLPATMTRGGNDVYGEYGYTGFSFHMRHQWVRIHEEMHERLSQRETKARKVEPFGGSCLRKGVSSVTWWLAPTMGSSTATGCLRHDEEMDRRTEEGGIRIVDPQARPEDEGEPHIYGWSAMILVAIADETATRDSQEILKQHAESITDPKMLLDLVFVCRTRRCYDKRQLRVHFSVHSSLEPVLAALIKCFVNRGAKLKRGLPPKTGGARELQRLLSELEGIE